MVLDFYWTDLMYSLSYVLTNQHGDELVPFRCNAPTIARLLRYFEEIVTENDLSSLVIAGRCLDGEPQREAERLTKLLSGARHFYFFSCDRSCPTRTWNPDQFANLTELEEKEFHSIETGPFILVMDPRFSGLLASYRVDDTGPNGKATYELIWTFDPNVVFTGIEYLMSRITVQRPWERPRFEALLNSCSPHSSSIRLSLAFTTKLAMLLQRQNELETALSTISSAISGSLDMEKLLQSTVDEVGRALKSRRAALALWEEETRRLESINVYEREDDAPASTAGQQAVSTFRPPAEPKLVSRGVIPGRETAVASRETGELISATCLQGNGKHTPDVSTSQIIPGQIEIPIVYRNSIIGVLSVEDDTPGREWESEEKMMVRMVTDQLAVAISHLRLFKIVQTQAMTDSLTGLFNHRYFQDRLEREIKLTGRNGEPVSLILLDLDHLKRVNDTLGHRAGDECLTHVANVMRATVRSVDICARYGGEEFVVILPSCGKEQAFDVAERLREAIANSELPRIGRVTASIGVATYPEVAGSREELIEMADRAMYLAKASGRNRVKSFEEQNVA